MEAPAPVELKEVVSNPPNDVQNPLLYIGAVIALTVIALLTIGGIIFLSINDKPTESLIALAGVEVGGFVSLLTVNRAK